MTREENPCKEGLTPECFKKYPKYAKKVFAYKLLQAVVGSPLSADLQKMLWRHLVQVPISWMSWEDFIIPDDIPLEEIISDDWDPDDPLPDELTINLNEIIPDDWKEGDELPDGVTIEPGTEIPDDWKEGDELPDGVTIEPGTEIPDDWKVGDEIPDGITIDTSKLFGDDWTASDPLPEGIVINIDVILPKVWTVGEDLPFGITVDPDFRIDVDMLETLGIYIEEGKTYEGLFGAGWDPTTELPGGSSWKPYKKDEVIIESAVPPLYLPVFTPGPVHRVSSSPIIGISPWFNDDFNTLDPAVWDYAEDDPTRVYVSAGNLVYDVEALGPSVRLYTWGTIPVAYDYDIIFTLHYTVGDSDIDFFFRAGNTRFTIKFSFAPDEIVITSGANTLTLTDNFFGAKYNYKVAVRSGVLSLYQNNSLIGSGLTLQVVSTGYYEIQPKLFGYGKTHIDYIRISPTE